jgi:hypothetical protein
MIMSTYQPGWQSQEYHRLSKRQQSKIISEVNRRFREETGVKRQLERTGTRDRELRHTWLRIRDAVMDEREKKQVEEDLEFQYEMFLYDLIDVVISDMKMEGWTQGAKLLEIWASRPPAIEPKYSAAVTNVITMDWVLQFPRAKQVFDTLVRERIWTNDASRGQIAKLVKSQTTGAAFGDLSLPVTQVDSSWINSRSCTSGFNVDGLTAALGAFMFQVAVAGTVTTRVGASVTVSIREVGVYVKDSFDFNGSQFLGFWGHRDTPVNNAAFRDWRTKFSKGGDFEVFSDIKRIKLTTPDLVTVTV